MAGDGKMVAATVSSSNPGMRERVRVRLRRIEKGNLLVGTSSKATKSRTDTTIGEAWIHPLVTKLVGEI